MMEDYDAEIKQIMGEIKCPKDFRCVKSGFENLCDVKIRGKGSLHECMDGNPKVCTFAISYGYRYFCDCPLRQYLAKNLKG